MGYRSYFAVVLAALAALVAAVLLMNWLVDPLDVYRVVRKPGFNSVKSAYIPYARLAKPSQIERGHYRRLAIGSSRMLMGIPVANAAWSAYAGEPGFDAGIQGSDLRSIRDLFEHAVATGEVRSVIVDVDLFMFNAWLSSSEYPYPVATLAETPARRFLRERDTAMLLLFSPGVTLSSIETLRKQDPRKDKVMLDGTTDPDNEQQHVLRDGYEVRFRQFEERLVRTGWSPCRDNRFAFTHNGIDKLQYFRDILRIAHEHHVDVKFFIPPVHARLLEMQDVAGLWDESEQMKRVLLAEMVAVYGEQLQGVALWDFSGYHRYAVETVQQQPGVVMQWYLDSSHFSQALGHRMLDVMFGSPAAETDFGVQLLPANIEAVLQAQRGQQTAFRQMYPDLSADLRERAQVVLRDKQANGSACTD